MRDERNTARYKAARTELLAENPLCHWCKRAPATELDHLVEVDKGGPLDDGYVAACKPCNSRRGAQHLNARRAQGQRSRTQGMNRYEPRTCPNCLQTFVPMSQWVKAGEQTYCSRDCYSQHRRTPRWTITTTWDCAVCQEPQEHQRTVANPTQPKAQEHKSNTCADQDCINKYNAIAIRDKYREQNPNVKARDSKYGELKPTNKTTRS